MVGSEFNRTRGKREEKTRGDWDLWFCCCCCFVCLFFFSRQCFSPALYYLNAWNRLAIDIERRNILSFGVYRAHIERDTAIQKLQNSPRNYTLPDGASGNPYISHKFLSSFKYHLDNGPIDTTL